MKIHGTAKGGALSKKDFGVAFGGGTPPESTELWAVTGTGEEEALSTAVTMLGQLFETGHVLIGKTITRFDVNLCKQGSPTNDITAQIINASNVEQLNLGTLDSSTLLAQPNYVTHTFENTDGYVLADGDRLVIGGSFSDSARPVMQGNTSTESYTNASYYTSSWTSRSYDFTMAVYGY